MGGGQRPTIKTVAARAGVGRTTVSRVINGSSLVSDEARSAVMTAIAELGYVPNSVARGLVTSRTDSVALVVPESESRLGSEPYFSAVIRGVSTGLADTRTQLQQPAPVGVETRAHGTRHQQAAQRGGPAA
ncbi:LacI family DNA-binding transcriptional regulator, partial [Streptomyces zhihengii]